MIKLDKIMSANKEENLDDVIAGLIDTDEEKEAESSSAFEGIDINKTTTGVAPVSLTERAARQVEKIMDEENLDENLYLRVAVEGGGCSGLSYKLGLDYKTEDDEVIESQGIEVIVASKHMMYLEGISIDYPDGLDARGFTFNNPNASETCGCGSSFAT
jgi:iron-sulfur cluster assembly protein